MKLFKLFFLIATLFIFSACGKDSDKAVDIPVNSTVKVYSKEYSDQKDDLLFFWTPPIGPKNSNPTFRYSGFHNDTLVFTPHSIGIYKILLTIENMESVTLDEIEFYYNIIENEFNDSSKQSYSPNKKDNLNNDNSQNLKSKKETKKQLTKKPVSSKKKKNKSSKSIKSPTFVVQVGAWPSIEQAKIDQKELYDEGFDAYIEKIFVEKSQSFWYRVRIGDFKNKTKAQEIKRKVDSIRQTNSWLTKK